MAVEKSVRGARLKHRVSVALVAAVTAASTGSAQADVLDDIGVRSLYAQTGLDGTGVDVAQGEATTFVGTVDQNDFEVNPNVITEAQAAAGLITYINSSGNTFTSASWPTPSSFGSESGHADTVASLFYGQFLGPSPNVDSVLNYNANYLINDIIFTYTPINAQVINQSFTINASNTTSAYVYAQRYDNYIDGSNAGNNHILVVTAAGNGGAIQIPGTAYNVITVGAYGGPSSEGPVDGRSKPDIVAPGGFTSFTTPLVSGVATLLMEAGDNGAAGNVNKATDVRTIKAVLLNGADKPDGWVHTATTPLDFRYGAGVVDALSSYNNLVATSHTLSTTTIINANQSHPALLSGSAVGMEGWNLRTFSISSTQDTVDHYDLNLTSGSPMMTLTATAVWNRVSTGSDTIDGIANLDLFLYNANTGSLVYSSISSVDNVEQLSSLVIGPGQYDLQVVMDAGISYGSQKYALAWNVANIDTSTSTLTSNNGLFEFATSHAYSGTTIASSTQIDSGATLNFNGGSNSAQSIVGTGKLEVGTAGGTSTSLISNGVTTSTFQIDANATATIRANGTLTGTSKVSLLTIAGTVGAWTGKLDLGANTLIVEATGSADKSSKMTLLQSQIASGSSGNWTGTGITSSSVASNANSTLALVNNAELGATTFAGQSVDSNSLIVTQALIGDLNLNGAVDFSDLLTVAQNFGQTGGWALGDMNGDPTIDFGDLLMVAQHFGQTLGLLPDGADSGITGAPTGAVPEPSSLMLLGVAGGGILLKRRKPNRH